MIAVRPVTSIEFLNSRTRADRIAHFTPPHTTDADIHSNESLMTTSAVDAPLTTKQTQLQRVLTAALNDLNLDAALAAIFHREGGPLTAQARKD
jgi:hypothetical protein